jgi:hypothetical protein
MAHESPKSSALTRTSDGTGWLKLTTCVALAACVAGIVYACTKGHATDAARGGAVAIALTFVMLFMGRGTAEEALTSSSADASDPARSTLDQQLKAVRNDGLAVRAALVSLLDWHRKERIYLTITSLAGTLTSGFGDWIARCLGASG